MNFDFLKTRLHIDQVHLWNRVNELVEGQKSDDRDSDSDVTLEYYVDLITKIVRGLNDQTDRDSKHVQTESGLDDDEFEKALDTMENNNRILEGYCRALASLIMYPHCGVHLPKECLDDIDWNISSKVMSRVDCVSNSQNFDKFLHLMEEKDALLKNIIASQHVALASLAQSSSASRSSEGPDSLLRGSRSDMSRLRMELETYRSKNELFNVRLELYRSELSRIYSQCEPSLSNPPIVNK